MDITLVIKGQLPGLNEYTRACRSNAYAGAKMKKRTEKIITAYIMQQLKGVHFPGTVELSFYWYEKNRKRDLDNICFAKKFILDALVNNKIIVADSWRGVVGFTDHFLVDPDEPRIVIEIREAENIIQR